MNTTYLLVGGNIGDRFQNLQLARNAVETIIGKIETASAIYETDAWGNTDQPAFLNQVLQVTTSLKAEDLLKNLLEIEKKLGRQRLEKMGPRTIDLDILFFNDDVIDLPHLIVPHPQISNRRFVLEPLAEIASSFVHPTNQHTVAELLADCKDTLQVRKLL